MSTLNDFHYALTLAEMLYGVTIREDLGEEILLTGWNLIGNKRIKLYRYTTYVNSDAIKKEEASGFLQGRIMQERNQKMLEKSMALRTSSMKYQ